MTSMLKIAVQKKGRMSEDSVSLLKKCGLKFHSSTRSLVAPSYTFPAEILYLRDDDIPSYVEDGMADIGIVGENTMVEKGAQVDLVKGLDFAKCRLALAVPRDVEYVDVRYFEGKVIATSYPNILRSYLKDKGVEADISFLSGSVEIATGIGLAQGIFDIVSTGSTLLANGLKEVEVVMNSEAVLIGSPEMTELKRSVLDQLLFRMNAVQRADEYRYILLNAPNTNLPAILEVLPGMRSPTVLPLAEEGWSSVHSVVREREFWEIVDQLKANGAEGLLITPIDKMIL